MTPTPCARLYEQLLCASADHKWVGAARDECGTMLGTRQAIAIGLVALLPVMSALAQDRPRRGIRGANSIEAAFDYLGLTAVQIDKVLEIRRESPARGQSWEQIDAWRESKLARLREVLNADQKASLDELGDTGKRMLVVMSSGSRGLSRPPRGPRAAGSGRGTGGGRQRGPGAGRGSSRGRGGTSRGQPGGAGRGSAPRPNSPPQVR